MTPNETFQTFQTAIRHGGGFMAKLAEAGLVADSDNRRKLLEACCQVAREYGFNEALLHRIRRPKPKSEKQQALDAFDRIEYAPSEAEDFATILRAIKSIPDEQ